VQHGRPQDDDVERIVRMLAGVAAAREERLKRLRCKLNDAIAFDAPGPAALEMPILRA